MHSEKTTPAKGLFLVYKYNSVNYRLRWFNIVYNNVFISIAPISFVPSALQVLIQEKILKKTKTIGLRMFVVK